MAGHDRRGTEVNNRIILVAILTLALVMISVIGVFLYGLFDQRVDNSEILKILGPAFQTIVGCFAGLIGGYKMGFSDGGEK